MLVLISGALWGGLIALLLSRALRQFRAYRRAALPVAGDFSQLPSVSIIVPARNEIANIGACLESLRAQIGLNCCSSVIIVDDDSQDGTAEAVRTAIGGGNNRITLTAAGALPEGWIGKPHACWRGALLAEGDWLCFIDADVRASPQLVAAAVATAEADGIDMVSLQPLQEFGSFWERLVMPAGLLLLACAKPFRAASQDVANGQFLLLRREAYFQLGGHATVRAEICEDKALAARAKAAGLEFRVFAAEHLARTRMYRDFRSLWEGLSKNATEALGSTRATLIAAAAAPLIGWAALLLPIALTLAAFAEPSPAAAIGSFIAVLGSVVVLALQFGTARHFRIPAIFGLTFALGYTAVACLACHGVLSQIKGRVTWKGRTYQLTKTSPERR
jgi:chlorobactene glucosyltransferase